MNLSLTVLSVKKKSKKTYQLETINELHMAFSYKKDLCENFAKGVRKGEFAEITVIGNDFKISANQQNVDLLNSRIEKHISGKLDMSYVVFNFTKREIKYELYYTADTGKKSKKNITENY